MVFIIILGIVLMKINNHHIIYQSRDKYLKKLRMLKAFYIKRENEIKQCQLERIDSVTDYDGDPVMKDRQGNELDWVPRLYHIKYQTKLRILPQ